MKKIFKPFCPHCGNLVPEDYIKDICLPCANIGHYSRLCRSERDRLQRITRWLIFYSEHGYTKKEIDKIPMMQNLLKNKAKWTTE